MFCYFRESMEPSTAASETDGDSKAGPSSAWRDHGVQMLELREKYYDLIYTQADKYLKQSQQTQLKQLSVNICIFLK